MKYLEQKTDSNPKVGVLGSVSGGWGRCLYDYWSDSMGGKVRGSESDGLYGAVEFAECLYGSNVLLLRTFANFCANLFWLFASHQRFLLGSLHLPHDDR